MTDTEVVTLRLLGGKPKEMAELQSVLEAASSYTHRASGLPVGPANAQSTYSILPPGNSYEDKFLFGVFRDGQTIGCIDLIRGWLASTTAHIGLLLLAEPFQGKGHARRTYEHLESCIRSRDTCTHARAGVVKSDSRVLPFWEHLGFVPTGELWPFQSGTVTSEVIILERLLPNVV